MRVALVHDPLYKFGGAERVLQSFHTLYPDAPLYTPLYDEQGTHGAFTGWDIRTSFLQKIPGNIRLINFLRALMPLAVEQWDLTDYDIVISSSTSVAKGVLTKQDTLHISYLHNVTRFAWYDLDEHIAGARFGITSWPARAALSSFRQWDFLAADRPDALVANSENVRRRIEKYYRRTVDAVIHPPVAVERFQTRKGFDNFFLIVSRLEPHKKVDLAIEACHRAGVPLKIVGEGPQESYLKGIAQSNVEFLGRLSDEKYAALMSRCAAFLYPQEEDFGISAVEAMAAGRPVIAYGQGGALETMVSGVTGEFFTPQTPEALSHALASFEPGRYTPSRIRSHAQQFAEERFRKEFGAFVHRKVNAWNSKTISP